MSRSPVSEATELSEPQIPAPLFPKLIFVLNPMDSITVLKRFCRFPTVQSSFKCVSESTSSSQSCRPTIRSENPRAMRGGGPPHLLWPCLGGWPPQYERTRTSEVTAPQVTGPLKKKHWGPPSSHLFHKKSELKRTIHAEIVRVPVPSDRTVAAAVNTAHCLSAFRAGSLRVSALGQLAWRLVHMHIRVPVAYPLRYECRDELAWMASCRIWMARCRICPTSGASLDNPLRVRVLRSAGVLGAISSSPSRCFKDTRQPPLRHLPAGEYSAYGRREAGGGRCSSLKHRGVDDPFFHSERGRRTDDRKVAGASEVPWWRACFLSSGTCY